MKRFLLFLALMLSCVVPSLAQIMSLSETNPAKSYTLTTERSSLCIKGMYIMSLAQADYTKDSTDPRQQFAFVKNGDDYYLMSAGYHLYVSNTGLLVSTLEQAQPIYLENGILKFDNTHVMNINGETNLVIGNWTTKDAGNTYVIEEAADFNINAEPSLFVLYINDIVYNLDSSSKTATIVGAAIENITTIEFVKEIEYGGDTYAVSPSIRNKAFFNCTSLISVIIPEDCTSIGNNAFKGCSSLPSITIPNKVTTIGTSAFEACSALTSVTIGSGVESIGDYAFESCSGLTSIIVESGNTVFDSRENCNAIIETSSNTLLFGCQNTVIPESVTSIRYNAFKGFNTLTSITIPSSVTSIGTSVFYGCTSLTSVTIGSGVESIGNNAFNGCSSLSRIYCNATTPPTLDDNVFSGMPINAVLFVPEESVSAYKASAWGTYFSNINRPFDYDYYFITSPARGANNAVYEDVSVNRVKWGSYTIPSDGDLHSSDLKYVWKISVNSEGKYTLQNVLSGRYMNKANKIFEAIPTTETATETFSIIPAECTTENEGIWILENSSTATADEVSGYCSGVHAAVDKNYVVQWVPDKPASHWNLIKLSEAEVAALENLIANKGNITFNYTIDGRAWRSQTRLVEDLSEVTAPEQEFVTIVSTSDLTDLHDGDVVTVECQENLPFLVTTDEEAPIYGIIHGHSNQDRYIYVDDSGNGKDTGSAGDPENVNDNYLWYITGNLIDGFRLHNKAFGGETLKGTETIATINGTASDIWELRGATHGSKFKEQDVFSLYQENVEYLNSHVNLNYWSTNDEGSSFYFEPQPIELVDGTEYTNGTSTKVGLLTYTRNFKNTNWQALYIPFALDYEEWCDDFDIAKIHNFIEYDDDENGEFDRTYLVVLKKNSGSTKANYPYLIRAKETGVKTLTLVNKTLEPAEINSVECGSTVNIYTFTGSYTPVTDMYANGYYALSGGALNKANSASVVLGAQRWYMDITPRATEYGSGTKAQSIKIVVDGEDETEAIEAPSCSSKGENPVAYDLMGRSVKGAVKGVSIVNGKKIIN